MTSWLWYHGAHRNAEYQGAAVTLLLLIRHGTNDWVHGRLAGWTPGVHLNDDGRRQAQSLATRLAFLPIDAIYSSPLDRTVETARAVAAPRGMPIQVVQEVGEVKYGEWQGAELKELYKHELWPGVQFYPSGTRFPNGETLGEAQIRMVTALDKLRAAHPKGIIAVFSHADIIKLAIAYYVGIHVDLFQRLEVQPCALTAIQFTRMGPRLLAFNDTGSLEYLKPRPEEPPAAEGEQPNNAHANGAAPAAEQPPATPAANPAEPTTQEAAGAHAAPDAATSETNTVEQATPEAAAPDAAALEASAQSNGHAPAQQVSASDEQGTDTSSGV
jgi:probable phosphoglycerate mutase